MGVVTPAPKSHEDEKSTETTLQRHSETLKEAEWKIAEDLEALEELTTKIPLAWWDHVPGGLKIKEYFDCTTLHGFKYFSEPNRSLLERYFWLVALLVVTVGAVITVYDQLIIFLHRPTLMSIDSTPTPVWNIPFPAITVCSDNQVRPSFFNFSNYSRNSNFTDREREIYEYVVGTCQSDLSQGTLKYFSPTILDEVHQNIWSHCSDTFEVDVKSKKSLMGDDACREILQPTLLSTGACHTFNSLPAESLYRPGVYNRVHSRGPGRTLTWSPDGGFVTDQETDGPPIRVHGARSDQKVLMILNLHTEDFESSCYYGGHGFIVVLHSPANLPTISQTSTYLQTDHYTNIQVVPDLKLTDDELRRWSPKERGCFYQDERPLKYFQLYTEHNCDLECESNVTLAYCGCVTFFHPRTKEMRICGPEKQKCYVESLAKTNDAGGTSSSRVEACNCMPSCNDIEYNMRVTSLRRNFSLPAIKHLFDGRYTPRPDNYAILSVHFQTQKVTAMKRVAVFKLTDFIANIGGLLGLFLGFSFLSLVEIFYFCTFRFYRKTDATTLNVTNNLGELSIKDEDLDKRSAPSKGAVERNGLPQII